jgi:RNA polymerase sigma-70 factor (ECF subfamily)
MTEQERAVQVELAAKSDADALQRLIVFYHGRLRRAVAAEVVGRWQRTIDADDVLQQAYVAAFKSIGGCVFAGPGGFYKWLETIALNQLKDLQRRFHRQKRDVGRERSTRSGITASFPNLLARLASPDSTPSRHLAKTEATAAVMSSLARLTDEQRAVVEMRFLEGRPVAEVAQQLGKTEPAVHMLCHRGLTRLRELLGSLSRYM